MSSWLHRVQEGIVSAPTTAQPTSQPSATYFQSNKRRIRDPNAPDERLQVEHKCIYERQLPGGAYVTAHLQRLQSGIYDSPTIHEDCINNVRFIAIKFVFHPTQTSHRIKSATISVALHDHTEHSYPETGRDEKPQAPKEKPRFLSFAPHILYGGISPETLDWNFNLAGSLGTSQAPVSANVSPSGGIKSSYKRYEFLRIQGSVRTLRSWGSLHHEYDIEDGELVWTLEENRLQKSGLPREFTFVMLVTKGDVENVAFDIEVEPFVASWFGHYPMWWTNSLRYQPLFKEHMDLDKELGQKFEPCVPGYGFNFANLAGTFDEYVSLPGTTYSAKDSFAMAKKLGGDDDDASKKSASPPPAAAAPATNTAKPQSSNDVNVYVHFPGYSNPGTPARSPAPDSSRRHSSQPLPKHRTIDIAYTPRHGSLRRSHSRTDLRDDSSRQSSTSIPPPQQQQQQKSQLTLRHRPHPHVDTAVSNKQNRYSYPVSVPHQSVNGVD